MKSQGPPASPEDVGQPQRGRRPRRVHQSFQGSAEAQTQLDQYTDLTARSRNTRSHKSYPRKELNGFRGVYLETAQRLKASRTSLVTRPTPSSTRLDFEFVLFASATID